MSTVSSTSFHSPLSDLTAKISKAVKAGALTQTDATALDSALSSIDSSLSASGASPSNTSPDQMKSKVDSLISEQVSNGTLSDAQAKELQAVFASGPGDRAGGAGGPPPPPSGDADTSTSAISSTSSSSSSVSDSSSSDDKMKALLAFLQNMRDAASENSGSYNLSNRSSSSGTSGAIYTNYA